jgi:CHAT domain-containing protein
MEKPMWGRELSTSLVFLRWFLMITAPIVGLLLGSFLFPNSPFPWDLVKGGLVGLLVAIFLVPPLILFLKDMLQFTRPGDGIDQWSHNSLPHSWGKKREFSRPGGGIDREEQAIVRAKQLLDQGNYLYGISEFHGAKRNFETALELARESGVRIGEVSALNCLGMICSSLRQPNVALRHLEEAWAILQELGGPEVGEFKRETLRCITDVCRAAGWHERALFCCQELLTLDRNLNDRHSERITLLNMAKYFSTLGQYDTAVETLKEVREIDQARGVDQISQANTLAEMGLAQANLGEFEVALESLEQALKIFGAYHHRIGQLEVHNSLGLVNLSLKRYEVALGHFNQVYAYLKEKGETSSLDDQVLEGIVLNNIGMIYSLHLEQHKKALEYFKKVLELDQALQNRASKLLTHHNLALVYKRMAQKQEALHHLKEADQIIEELRPEVLDEKLRIDYFGRIERVYGEYIPLLVAHGELKTALETIEKTKARTFLLQLGTGLPPPSLPTVHQPLLDREADLLNEMRALENDINAADVRLQIQQTRTRDALEDVWDQLEAYAPEYVALRRGKTISYPEMQALVDNQPVDTALVTFYTLPDNLDHHKEEIIVFVLRRCRKPEVKRVDWPRGRMESLLKAFKRQVMQEPDVRQSWQERARPLLADVLPYLNGAELVYLVPHGELYYLPLHALQLNGIYLIDHFPIVYALSITVLERVMRRVAEAKPTSHQPEALVLGYDPFEDEAIRIARFFRTEAYVGHKATGALLRDQAEKCNILHLACHGEYRADDPLKSHLKLADGNFSVREMMSLKLKADLVNLSACETARGGRLGSSDRKTGDEKSLVADLPRVPGDELTGMPRALLYAGASSVIVSLWKAEDRATKTLMTNFYQCWPAKDKSDIVSKAVALRQAMLKTRECKEYDFSHPHYWAPFILVGNWR